MALQGCPDMSTGQDFMPPPGWVIAHRLLPQPTPPPAPEALEAEDYPLEALPATRGRVLEGRSEQHISRSSRPVSQVQR